MPIYRVQSKQGTAAEPTPRVRLVKAERLAHVEAFLLSEVSIEKATQEEMHVLGKQGVEVEEPAL